MYLCTQLKVVGVWVCGESYSILQCSLHGIQCTMGFNALWHQVYSVGLPCGIDLYRRVQYDPIPQLFMHYTYTSWKLGLPCEWTFLAARTNLLPPAFEQRACVVHWEPFHLRLTLHSYPYILPCTQLSLPITWMSIQYLWQCVVWHRKIAPDRGTHSGKQLASLYRYWVWYALLIPHYVNTMVAVFEHTYI